MDNSERLAPVAAMLSNEDLGDYASPTRGSMNSSTSTREIVPEGRTAADYLHQQAYIGADWRYPQAISGNVQAQLRRSWFLLLDSMELI